MKIKKIQLINYMLLLSFLFTGCIIGYQGDSGNLKNAIKRGTTESHTHIKIKNSNGTIIDPEDLIGNLTITENEKINNNDCE